MLSIKSPKRRILLLLLIFPILLAGCGGPNIERLEERQDVEGLVELLDDEDPSLVIAAAEALGRIGAQDPAGWTGREIIRGLYAKSGHSDTTAALAIIAALGDIPDDLAAERLINILDDNDLDRRDAAIDALTQIGAAAVPPLIDVLRVKDPANIDPVVKDGVITALVLMGDDALKPLLQGLNDGPIHARESLTIVLDTIGWKPGADEYGTRYWIAKGDWDKAAGVGAKALGPLFKTYKDGDLGLEEMALYAIGQIRDPDAIEALSTFLAATDEDQELRAAAAQALAGSSGEAAIEILLSALEQDEWIVRGTVLQGLDQLAAPQVAELKPVLDALGLLCQRGEETDISQLEGIVPDSFYPLVILDQEGRVTEWTSAFILREEPVSSDVGTLVGCLDQDYVWLETCLYMGASNVSRVKEVIHINLWDAGTGEKLAREIFVGYPRDCPLSRYNWHHDTLYGAVSIDDIDTWLGAYLP